jgi:hypothetical protein
MGKAMWGADGLNLQRRVSADRAISSEARGGECVRRKNVSKEFFETFRRTRELDTLNKITVTIDMAGILSGAPDERWSRGVFRNCG